jgi:hypothetical protein
MHLRLQRGPPVLEIRQMLTSELQAAAPDDIIMAAALSAMRAACRKFLDTVGADADLVRFGGQAGHWASWRFNGAVGELRGVFGLGAHEK